MDKILQYKFLESLKSLPFISEIWLFGSRARMDNQERSDIDLAILCENASKEEEAKLIFEHIKTYLPVFIETYAFLKVKYN